MKSPNHTDIVLLDVSEYVDPCGLQVVGFRLLGGGHHLQTLRNLGIVLQRCLIDADNQFAADKGVKLGGDFAIAHDNSIVAIHFPKQIQERGFTSTAFVAYTAAGVKAAFTVSRTTPTAWQFSATWIC